MKLQRNALESISFRDYAINFTIYQYTSHTHNMSDGWIRHFAGRRMFIIKFVIWNWNGVYFVIDTKSYKINQTKWEWEKRCGNKFAYAHACGKKYAHAMMVVQMDCVSMVKAYCRESCAHNNKCTTKLKPESSCTHSTLIPVYCLSLIRKPGKTYIGSDAL